MRTTEKDLWDKFEIFSKFLGAAIIPIAVAASVFIWNSQRTQREVSVLMLGVAVDVLKSDPVANSESDRVIRRWAASVLENPSDPPTFGNEVAGFVVRDGFAVDSAFCGQSFTEAIERLKVALLNNANTSDQVGQAGASVVLGHNAGCKQ